MVNGISQLHLLPFPHGTNDQLSQFRGKNPGFDKFRQYPESIRGPNTAIGQDYLRSMSVAFFQTYLNNDTSYSPYLTSSYTQSISQDAMRLFLVQSLTAEQLQTAYGGPVPLSIEPEPIAPTPPSSSADILTEIADTGVLKAAIRTDAPPFGYLNGSGQWTGYCFDLLNALRQDLTKAVNRQMEIELVPLPSNLDNRFQLVQDQTVQLECGPSTIVQDIEGVSFSAPFFYTGTQFLVTQEPVTCDAYGLILPADDRAWRNQVSAFLNSERSTEIRNQWLADSVPEEVSTLEYCLDRQSEF